MSYPHPCLEPILERTLGVPLFQEQILRIAMEAAGFTGGQAEELRRAMGFKRSEERMDELESGCASGMTERGIVGEAQEQIVQSITSFALYGFPRVACRELRAHRLRQRLSQGAPPDRLLIALLNAWPMGFYHPASLIKDAQRHGVEVLPIDVAFSNWRCKWEDPATGTTEAAGLCAGHKDDPTPSTTVNVTGACRLGLRYVKGLRQEAGEAIERQRMADSFADLEDLTQRCDLREEELSVLAEAGALASLGLTRRQALWQVARVAKPAGPLLETTIDRSTTEAAGLRAGRLSPLPEMSAIEETLADFAGSGMTVGPHAMQHVREKLDSFGILRAADLVHQPQGKRLRTAGSVIVRQRPGTAKGLLFLTLEDETGMSQALVTPDLLQEHKSLIVGTPNLVVEGLIQRKDGSVSLRAERFWPLQDLTATPSHDFH